jgi:hypothetical protein
MGRCRCQDMGIWPSKSRRLLVNRCKKPQDNCLVRILFPDPKLPRIDCSDHGSNHRLKHRLERTKVEEGIAEIDRPIRDFDNHIETGFQLATFQGPLCAEPVVGMAYFVEQVDIDIKGLESEIGESHNSHQTLPLSSPSTLRLEQNRTQQITGSFVSSFKDACRNALLDWSPRLLLAMYSCEIQASSRFRFSMFVPSLIARSRCPRQSLWCCSQTAGSYRSGRNEGRVVLFQCFCAPSRGGKLWFCRWCVFI